jgi:hypothetical protein
MMVKNNLLDNGLTRAFDGSQIDIDKIYLIIESAKHAQDPSWLVLPCNKSLLELSLILILTLVL